MKKRSISKVLAFSMIMTLSGIPSVYAEGNPTVRLVADRASVDRGAKFTYTLTLDSEETVSGIQSSIAYPTEAFEFEQAEFIGSFATQSCVEADGTIDLMAALPNSDFNGGIAVFTFKVLDDAEAGSYIIESAGNGTLVTIGNDLATAELTAEPVIVNADQNAVFDISSSKSVIGREEEVVYNVKLSEITEVKALQAQIEYDTANFEYISAEADDKFDVLADVDEKDGIITLAAVAGEELAEVGNILEITLRSKSSCAYGAHKALDVTGFKTSSGLNEMMDIAFSTVCKEITIDDSNHVVFRAVPDKAEIKAGDTVVYTVSLSSELSGEGVQTALIYDSNEFTYVDAEKSDLMDIDSENSYFVNEIAEDRKSVV